ncbi:unnamed protein product [Pylaiella littoralis]
MAADMAALKDWVTARDSEQFSRLPVGVVSVNISHSNITARMIELKFDLSQTLGDVKGKIYTHCGTNPGMQKLSLRSGGQTLCLLDDDSKKLGFYGVQSGMEIHVTDDDPFSLTRGGALEDVSLVHKYRMSEEDYDKRKGTLSRSWVKEQKAKDSDWVEPWIEKEREAKKAAAATAGKAPTNEPPPGVDSVSGIAVEQRCEVQPGGRRGVVAFVGEVEGLQAGFWVGVRFDEPVGRGDGTVKGKRLFECEKGFGGFVRGKNVAVGDYPERPFDEGDDDDDDEDEI